MIQYFEKDLYRTTFLDVTAVIQFVDTVMLFQLPPFWILMDKHIIIL